MGGRVGGTERSVGYSESAETGDVLVAAEVSRLARLTLQVLELLQEAAQRGVAVYIAKHQMVLDDSLPATIAATVLDLAAQDRAGVYLGEDEGGARAPQSGGAAPSADRKAEPRS